MEGGGWRLLRLVGVGGRGRGGDVENSEGVASALVHKWDQVSERGQGGLDPCDFVCPFCPCTAVPLQVVWFWLMFGDVSLGFPGSLAEF